VGGSRMGLGLLALHDVRGGIDPASVPGNLVGLIQLMATFEAEVIKVKPHPTYDHFVMAEVKVNGLGTFELCGVKDGAYGNVQPGDLRFVRVALGGLICREMVNS
jgi:hypothetical protein